MPARKRLPIVPEGCQSGEATFKRAQAAYRDERDYGKAFTLYMQAGDEGYPRGWALAGVMWCNAEVTEWQDHGEGCRWFMKAAQAGDPAGKYYLGQHHLVTRPSEARRWFAKAARHGLKEAQDALERLDARHPRRPCKTRASVLPADATPSMRRDVPPGLLLGRSLPPEPASRPMGFLADVRAAQDEAAQGGDLIAFDGDSHALTFAPTGAGKGVSCVIPNAIMHEGALIVVDLAGDIYHATAQRRRDMGQKVYRLNLADEGGNGNSLNPLDLAALCGQDTAAIARSLASELVERSASSMDSRFWDDWGETMLTGGIAWLLADVPPEHRHIAHLFDLFTENDPVYSIAVALDSKTIKTPSAYKAFTSFLQLSERDTRPSVLAVAQAALRLFDSALVRKVTGSTSIDLDGLVRGDAVSLYITVPPARLDAFRPILRSWMSGLMFAFMQRKAEPKHRTLVLCDEMGNLGRINALVTSFTLVRKSGVTLWGFLQNPAQLDIYASQARTILDNAGVIQVFGARNRRMAADFAGLVGCDVEAVAALAKDEQLLLVDGGRPLKARRLRYYADKEFAGLYRDREPAMSR